MRYWEDRYEVIEPELWSVPWAHSPSLESLSELLVDPRPGPDEALEPEGPEDPEEVEDEEEDPRMAWALSHALSCLPTLDLIVLHSLDVLRLPQARMAEAWGVAQPSVSVRRQRAHDWLAYVAPLWARLGPEALELPDLRRDVDRELWTRVLIHHEPTQAVGEALGLSQSTSRQALERLWRAVVRTQPQTPQAELVRAWRLDPMRWRRPGRFSRSSRWPWEAVASRLG